MRCHRQVSERQFLTGLFLLAVVLRLAAVLVLGVPDPIESSEDGMIAARLVAGLGYTFDFYGYRTANPLQSFMPPLYTLFVSVFLRFTSQPATMLGICQALISSFTPLLVYGVAVQISVRPVTWLAGVATALYPVFIIEAARPFTLSLLSFLLASFLFLTVRLLKLAGWRQGALIGIVAGMMALVRATMLGLVMVIVIWMYLNRDAIHHWLVVGLAVIAFAGLTLMPWTVRNCLVHRQLVLISTNGGFTFWNGNNPFTTGSAFDVYVDRVAAYTNVPVDLDAVQSGIVHLRPYPLPPNVVAQVQALTEVELERELYRAGLRYSLEHPRDWLRLVARKVTSFWWFRPNIGRSRADLGEGGQIYDPAWVLPYKILYAAMFPLFLLGVLTSLKNARRYSILYFLFGYLTVAYSLFNVTTRYRWEIEPYILLFSGLGLVTLMSQAGGWIQEWKLLSSHL